MGHPPAGYWPWPVYENEERSPIPPYVPAKPQKSKDFPHDCRCGSPAYVGAYKIECTNSKCEHYKANSKPITPSKQLFGEDMDD